LEKGKNDKNQQSEKGSGPAKNNFGLALQTLAQPHQRLVRAGETARKKSHDLGNIKERELPPRRPKKNGNADNLTF